MNNKGFTLIELLVTIIILGIVTTIGITSANIIMGNVNNKTDTILKKNVGLAIDSYITENSADLSGGAESSPKEFGIGILVTKGYISEIEKDGNKCYADDTKVKVWDSKDSSGNFLKFCYKVDLNCNAPSEDDAAKKMEISNCG